MTRRRRLTLVTCCSVHSLQDGLTDLVYVLLPILAQSLGLTYSQVGTLRAANRGAMALFELPSGMLSERLGERALLGFGLGCGGLGYLALAGAGAYPALLICLFVAGAGAAFQHSLCSSVISKTFQGAAGASRWAPTTRRVTSASSRSRACSRSPWGWVSRGRASSRGSARWR